MKITEHKAINYKFDNAPSGIKEKIGIYETLTLISSNQFNGSIDNPSTELKIEIKKAFTNNKKIVFYTYYENGVIIKLNIENKIFNFEN